MIPQQQITITSTLVNVLAKQTDLCVAAIPHQKSVACCFPVQVRSSGFGSVQVRSLAFDGATHILEMSDGQRVGCCVIGKHSWKRGLIQCKLHRGEIVYASAHKLTKIIKRSIAKLPRIQGDQLTLF